MKLGIFMTGHFRDAPHTRENYAQFLDNYDVSFYVATWSSYDVNRETHQLELESVDVRGQMEAAIGSALKGMWIGDAEKFYNNDSPAPNSPLRTLVTNYLKREEANEQVKSDESWPFVQRISDQAYVTREAYKLVSSNEYDSFDVCLRIRGDMRFINKEPIPLNHTEDGIHTNSYWWTTACEDSTGLVPFRCGDHLLWGKPHWMRKYFDYYLYYAPYFTPLFVLPQHIFQYQTEHLLALYIQRFPYFRGDLDWSWPISNINERDCPLHKEGNIRENYISHSRQGISFYEYYDILSKGIR